MRRWRWFLVLVLVLVAAVGGLAYAVGLPSPVVYVIRGMARHLAYLHGGG